MRRLLFVRVPEPKATKNRMHVDLASKDPAAEVERLVTLGRRARQQKGTPCRPSPGSTGPR